MFSHPVISRNVLIVKPFRTEDLIEEGMTDFRIRMEELPTRDLTDSEAE